MKITIDYRIRRRESVRNLPRGKFLMNLFFNAHKSCGSRVHRRANLYLFFFTLNVFRLYTDAVASYVTKSKYVVRTLFRRYAIFFGVLRRDISLASLHGKHGIGDFENKPFDRTTRRHHSVHTLIYTRWAR